VIQARDSERGITLLEIMVVLLIVALLAGALTVGYQRLPATALKREATRMAAALRSAYDRATASGALHRLVLDVDAGTFHIERCEGKIEVRKSRDLGEEQERQRAEAEKETILSGMQSADQLTQSIVGDGKKLADKSHCEPVKDAMGKKQTLAGTPKVSYSKIWVGHLEDPVVKGEVSINFFPMGTAERAVIELAVDEDRFSLILHPLSGRIEMQQGEVRWAEALVTEDAEGKKTE
jgi:prepilin-type N-terminal cleavage/methylation domain-containing protein